MVKLTPLKIRRMSLGLRQLDVVIGTGISHSRYSSIENELTQPHDAEWARIQEFLRRREADVKSAAGLAQ
jgi:transcriptional regulator with XRE-family HTH domain